MRTFLRELEAIMATMDEAARDRLVQFWRNVIVAFTGGKEAMPGLSKKAFAALIGDLMLLMSMNKNWAHVKEKADRLAKEIGPHVEWFLRAL